MEGSQKTNFFNGCVVDHLVLVLTRLPICLPRSLDCAVHLAVYLSVLAIDVP